ncbi:MAG: hypothetical protein NUW37_05630 [Planctomycetes bacterium]|nr:hypothetical protein [Planctomycetota bacterium]
MKDKYLVSTVITYVFAVTMHKEEQIVKFVEEQISKEAGEEAKSTMDRLLDRGRAEGRAEGTRNCIEELVRFKFGGEGSKLIESVALPKDHVSLSTILQRLLRISDIEDARKLLSGD